MIDYELFSTIKHLKEHQGLTAPQIASELAIDVRTIRKWLTATFHPTRTPPRPSKLDPFEQDIVCMLQTIPTPLPKSSSVSMSDAGFYLTLLRLTFSPREFIRLRRMNKGATLRGAFGTVLPGFACVRRVNGRGRGVRAS